MATASANDVSADVPMGGCESPVAVSDDVPVRGCVGGCEGPDSMYVKLISLDKHEFIIKRQYAVGGSETIKKMLSGPGVYQENETSEIKFREIPFHVLQKVCMYFVYKVQYTNSEKEIPEFPLSLDISLELLMAANFLDC